MNTDALNLDSLGEILGNLSEQDIEGLNELAGSLFGGKSENNQSKQKSNTSDFFSGSFPDLDMESISRIMSIMQKLRSQPRDPGCDLIAALKPLLSEKRQKRADEAISMLRMISLLPLIGEVMN